MVYLYAILICAATYRVTRLLTEDKIPLIAVPRTALYNWLDPHETDLASGRRRPTGGGAKALAYLLTCPWCMSVWVAGGLLLLLSQVTTPPMPSVYLWLLWPAASAVTGLAATWEGLAEKRYERDDTETDLARERIRLATAERLLVEAQTKQARLTLPENMR